MDEKRIRKLTISYELIEQQFLFRHEERMNARLLWKQATLRFRYQFLSHYAGIPPLWRIALRSVGGRRILPNYAVVGPIKSGSSDLVTHLLLHPNVMTPLAKEIYSPEPESWRPFFPTEKVRIRHEKKHGKALVGYLAPFLSWYRLIDRFAAVCPDAKIVIPLRNPVSRAYSHWKWDVLQGGNTLKHLDYYSSFDRFVDVALDLFPEMTMDTVCGFPFLESGIYVKAVEQWINRFGRDNVMIFDVKDYFVDRNAALARVQDFLGIPIIRFPEAHKPVNQNPLKKQAMDEETKSRLINFYKPYNEKLYTLIGQDFGW